MKKFNNEPSRIIGIQFSILSPEEIKKQSVAEIVKRDTYINNKPVVGGLFDPRMGILDPGLICPTDGLNYINTPGYFGHIDLARPVFYIQFLDTIKKILKCVCLKCSKLLINKNKYKYLLRIDPTTRWSKHIYSLCSDSKIKRCGDDTCDGCGTLAPKIKKEGLSSLSAVWKVDDYKEGVKEVKLSLTPEKVLKIFERISDEDVEFMGFSSIWSRPEWMICKTLAIPPPAVRPSVQHSGNQRSEDDLSHIIVTIIKANNSLKEKIQKKKENDNDITDATINDWTSVLQYYIATMVDNKIPGCAPVAQRSGRTLKSIKERLVGKAGRVRGNLMGKRVDFSSRSVITPDARIGIQELGVPMKIAMNITFPEKVNERNKDYLTMLVMKNKSDIYPGAKILEKKEGDLISLKYVNTDIVKVEIGDIVHRHLQDGDPILFNRQPTLHRMSMMCHYVKVMKEGDTFRMNVADTKPYNADFDGDEMNMHCPQDYQSQVELSELANVSKHIISPANNKSIIGIFQDSLLATYRMTRPNENFNKRTAMNLLMNSSSIDMDLFNREEDKISNFEILSQILPKISCKFGNSAYNGKIEDEQGNKVEDTKNTIKIHNGIMKSGQIDKGVLGANSKGLIQTIYNDFGYKKAVNFINNLQNIVTDYMKLSSYSVGISDLIADDETNNKISNILREKKEKVRDLMNETHLGILKNEKGNTNDIEFETKVNELLNKARDEAGKIGKDSLSQDNRFVIMVNAGSKGSTLNIAQMISCLGQQNVDGKRIPYGFENRTLPHYTKYDDSPEARGFVESSFIQGLTPEELFFHAMGGRVGLIDTAVKTSQTGYIQRRLIKSTEDLKVAYDMTVRNGKNKIIQFEYGYDNFDPMKVEKQKFPLLEKKIEELYEHYIFPDKINNESIIEILVFKETVKKKYIKQVKKYNEKIKDIIIKIINNREMICKNVFENKDNNSISMPVNFKRLIENVNNQFENNNYEINITPLDMYKLIDKTYKIIENMGYIKCNNLFKILYYWYLNPKDLLIKYNYTKKSLKYLLDLILLNYKKALINPGEMVGIVGAQSIGEPTTQMTLNTFHFAGVASKSNVTRGVPRIEELLSLTENIKKPSITVSLKDTERHDLNEALKIKHQLEYTTIGDITNTISICYNNEILKKEPIYLEHKEFLNQLKNGLDDDDIDVLDTNDEDEENIWIILLELNKELILEKEMELSDILFAIDSITKDPYCKLVNKPKEFKNTKINTIYSDLNSNEVIFRININFYKSDKCKLKGVFKSQPLDAEDQIHQLKCIQEFILNKIVLKGVKNVSNVLIRKSVNNLVLKNNEFIKEDFWVLDTIGSNLKEFLKLTNIDANNTVSNNIQEVYNVLGIEAARKVLYNEITEAFEENKINTHHIDLLCDRICATKKMVSVFRHGINKDDIGPIAKASFEETPEMFFKAAIHGELDPLTGVSANIMCGQKGLFGTNMFQIVYDINTAKKNSQGYNFENEEDILKDFENESKDNLSENVCSNIEIHNNVKHIKEENNIEVDNDWDIDF